ncbi:37S ribosomal protein S9, mitochondrial, partial [Coemansia nantahalensis]
KLDVKLTVNEYKTLQERLNQADRLEILDEEERTTVQLYLNQFRRGYRHMEVVKMDGEEADKEGSAAQAPDKPKKKKKLHSYYGNKDDLGRWFAGGRRKTARACVWLTPVARPAPTIASVSRAVDEAVAAVGLALREAGLGPAAADAAAAAPTEAEIEAEAVPESVTFGEVLVNGKPLADYFVRRTDRESVVFPFQVAQRLGHYYAFLKVSGGGSTGQAEACQLAVARALAAATGRDGHYSIRAAGLLTPDGRAVERKKTGKPKARKSYTWVKR